MELGRHEAAHFLQRLPLRAIVALAARCALRSRWQFDLSATVPNRETHLAAVDAALRLALDFARTGRLPADAQAVVHAAFAAAVAAPEHRCTAAATLAGLAANAALTSLTDPQLVPLRSAFCLQGGRPAEEAAWVDFVKLLGFGLGRFPDLGEGIDASESGPLGMLQPMIVQVWPTPPPLAPTSHSLVGPKSR
jgi:hypothetical protein